MLLPLPSNGTTPPVGLAQSGPRDPETSPSSVPRDLVPEPKTGPDSFFGIQMRKQGADLPLGGKTRKGRSHGQQLSRAHGGAATQALGADLNPDAFSALDFVKPGSERPSWGLTKS